MPGLRRSLTIGDPRLATSGGDDGIAIRATRRPRRDAVVDSFVGRCAGDSRIDAEFARTDVPRLKKMLVDQVCEAAGGPCVYTGRDMRETHDGMGVTAGEFDALVEDMVATLNEFQVPEAEKDELLGLLRRCVMRSSRSSRRRRHHAPREL